MGPIMKAIFYSLLVGIGAFYLARIITLAAFFGIVSFDKIVGPDVVLLLSVPSIVISLAVAIVVAWRFDGVFRRTVIRP